MKPRSKRKRELRTLSDTMMHHKYAINISYGRTLLSFSLKILFIYLFLDRGEEREKERKENINVWLPLMCPLPGTWPATQECTLTGN